MSGWGSARSPASWFTIRPAKIKQVVLRRTILYLARHKALRKWVETSAAARKLSSRFIAGSQLSEALAVCRKMRADGITATLDYLGENVRSLDEAAACRDMYLQTLHAMHDAGVEPNVSLKLTQFGLDLSEEACETNVGALVKAAADIGGFVRIDMEGSQYTDRTLSLVTRLHARYGACGTVIQAYLRRSTADIECLERERIRVRLCKGAYLEPPEVAFEDKADVDRNYLRLAESLLTTGEYPAIATHDERIINTLERFVTCKGIARDRFEFQMLYGIRRDLQRRLVADGYRLRLYVPFGEAWYPYFMRRLAERPANLLFFARNLLRH
jgi:proline dehydrogenase